jgi:hypothetical protein
MVHSLPLAVITAFLAGCAGTLVSPPQSATLPQAVGQSLNFRGVSPAGYGRCKTWPGGSGILENGDFHLSPSPGRGR